jgi:hypothetical protein
VAVVVVLTLRPLKQAVLVVADKVELLVDLIFFLELLTLVAVVEVLAVETLLEMLMAVQVLLSFATQFNSFNVNLNLSI